MKNKRYLLNIIAIMFLFAFGGCGTYENSAVQTMIEAWPNIAPSTIRLLVTLPSLTSTIAMLAAGQTVGKYFKYRTCLIAGATLGLVSGILPFFIHCNWYFILVCRFFLGIGVGLLSIRNSLLILSVPAKDLAKMIGYASVFGSLISACISPIVGWLSSLGWEYSFLSNGLLLVCVITTIIFVQEPETNKQETVSDTPVIEVEDTKMPRIIYVFFVVQTIATLVLYPLLSGISSYLSEINVGNATIAGFLLSVYTGAGIFSNLFLGQLQKILKDKILTVFLLMPFIGMFIIINSTNIILIGIGVFLSGMGYVTFSSTEQVYVGLFCNARNVAKASTLMLAATQLGVFLSSYFIDLTANVGFYDMAMKNTYFVCMATYLIFAILSFIFKKYTTPKQTA